MNGRALRDGHGRGIDYLRIAVTDKCNFRCVYCMPEEGVPNRRHEELLTAEEIARFVRLVAREGVKRVRLTGGEPLVSKRIIPLVRELREIPQIEDIALTTNGALLPVLAGGLREAGLGRVNISLDTLRPSLFSQITRTGRVEQALAGIDAALEHGIAPVKVNCVVVRRLQQDLFDIAMLSVDRPVHVRFIEYMPIGHDDERGFCARDVASAESGGLRPEEWDESDTVPSAELLERLSEEGAAARVGALEPVDGGQGPLGAGPARYWRFPGARGTVGFISAMSSHFCGSCNRMRLTADGAIRPCLFSDAEYRVLEALRAGDDEAVLAAWRRAVSRKPKEHEVIEGTERFMSQIGG